LHIPQGYNDSNSYASHLTSLAESHASSALHHLDLAYTHYRSLPHHQQQEVWQIELARAFVAEKEKRKLRDEELEEIVVEARQMHGQVETLSRCQWPREMALWPPERKPIGKRVVQEMERREADGGTTRTATMTREGGTADADMAHQDDPYGEPDQEEDDPEDKTWDYDTLVGKWKKIVREDAVRRRGLTLPAPTTTNTPFLLSGAGGGGISALNPSPNTTSIPIHHQNNHHYNPPAAAPATAIATESQPATTTKRKDHNPHPTFQPWSKRPKLLNGEERMIGIPVSDKQQQQSSQQPHQPPQQSSHSSLRDLIAAADATGNNDPKHGAEQQQQEEEAQQNTTTDANGVYESDRTDREREARVGKQHQHQQWYGNGTMNGNNGNGAGDGQGDGGAGRRDMDMSVTTRTRTRTGHEVM
jgi:hypothetical protein